MKTLLLTVRGRVQGVGFRAHVMAAAASHGVKGWVRNAPDGSVEVAVQGAPGRFLDEIRRGPRWGRVDTLESHEVEEEPYVDFTVRF